MERNISLFAAAGRPLCRDCLPSPPRPAQIAGSGGSHGSEPAGKDTLCGIGSACRSVRGNAALWARRRLEIELLTRRLAEAQAEIRRYETRLFAYERAMVALRRRNAELQALCEKAREGEALPPPELDAAAPVLEKPELPVIHFPAPAGMQAWPRRARRVHRDPAGHRHP